MTHRYPVWFRILGLLPLLAGCQSSRPAADLLVHHAVVYTVDSVFTTAEALVVTDGRIVAVGKSSDLLRRYRPTRTLDAGGKALFPGFIDGHCHFYHYGLGLRQVDLRGTTSLADVVARLVAHRRQYPAAAWLEGRGWDQNDWADKSFPRKDTLDRVFPGLPILLARVDGHAALASQRALDLAGLTPQTTVAGGRLEVRNGQLTGLLVDNAVGLVSRVVPQPTRADAITGLLQAQRNCFAVGLTTVDDAGLDRPEVALIDSLQRAGTLSMRVYAMLSPTPANEAHYFATGPVRTDRLHVRSFKVYADGALGSRGACLLADYADQPGQRGFLLRQPAYYRDLARRLYQHGFQMNTHCIGDSANRFLLDVYGQTLGGKNDRRWRIEHAQIVAPADVAKFGRYSVIPSVQATHATSDMYWAGARLGNDRLPTAYPYQQLLAQNGWLVNGTDFPVEEINPLYTFFAATARQDGKGFPAGGFQVDQSLTRQQALRSMTAWAARGNFEEDQKGSLEAGKLADFVILSEDLMQASLPAVRRAQVIHTFVGGRQVK